MPLSLARDSILIMQEKELAWFHGESIAELGCKKDTQDMCDSRTEPGTLLRYTVGKQETVKLKQGRFWLVR